MQCIYISFVSESSLTDTDDSQEGTGTSFIPLYHFHQLTNIQAFICNFAWEMTITYFQSRLLDLPNCYSVKFTTLSNYHLIDWWCDVNFCLSTWWFDSRFCWSNLTKETDGLELVSTITIVSQVNRLTKCVSHPNPLFLKMMIITTSNSNNNDDNISDRRRDKKLKKH